MLGVEPEVPAVEVGVACPNPQRVDRNQGAVDFDPFGRCLCNVAIAGAGPAGLTAAIYAARRKISFLILSTNIGGQAVLSCDVENYPGMHVLTGKELI